MYRFVLVLFIIYACHSHLSRDTDGGDGVCQESKFVINGAIKEIIIKEVKCDVSGDQSFACADMRIRLNQDGGTGTVTLEKVECTEQECPESTVRIGPDTFL